MTFSSEQTRVNVPVFLAAMQVLLAAALTVIVSIVWHWPYNALPLIYTATSIQCYALVHMAARGES